MYRRHDRVYLPDKQLDLTVHEFSTYVEEILGRTQKDGLGSLGEEWIETILMLAYACQYITREELSFYFGPTMANSMARRRFSQMVRDKMLASETFKPLDGFSRNAYCLARPVIENVGMLFPLECRNSIKKRRTSGIVPEHDYSCGINMIQLIVSGLNFIWRKEYVLQGQYRTKRTVRTDLVAAVKGREQRTLYIEQDMGTENIGQLIEKIAAYGDHSVHQDENNILFFSMRKVSDYIPFRNAFADDAAQRVYKAMKEGGFQELYDFYCHFCQEYDSFEDPSLKDRKFLGYVKRLLCLTEVCSSKVSVSSVDATTPIEHIKGHTFSISDMQQFCEDSEAMRNPYVKRAQNVKAVRSAFSKELSMLSALARSVDKGLIKREEVFVLLCGMATYVVPTDLLGNHLKYVFPDTYHMEKCYRNILCAYYAFYQHPMAISTPYFDTGVSGMHIRLRNAFLCEIRNERPADAEKDAFLEIPYTPENEKKKGIVCVESINDLSALIRAYFIYRMVDLADTPYQFIHFIFHVDESWQAYRIAELFGIPADDSYLTERPIFFGFISRRELDKKRAIFGVDCYGTDKSSFGSEERDFYETFPYLPAYEKITYDVSDMANLEVADVAKLFFGNDA